jgi:hypothetical protein
MNSLALRKERALLSQPRRLGQQANVSGWDIVRLMLTSKPSCPCIAPYVLVREAGGLVHEFLEPPLPPHSFRLRQSELPVCRHHRPCSPINRYIV